MRLVKRIDMYNLFKPQILLIIMRVRYSFGSRHTGHLDNITKQKEKFPKLVRDIVRISDILLEVLDSRFIEESRNEDFEKLIKEQGKKIIYILNKSDLVDKEKVRKQITENHPEIFPFVFVSCKNRSGSREIRNRIKIEVSKLEKKKDGGKFDRAQVGIIGYPNTGKSSLINLITGKSAARVGAESGFTKGMQKISLTKSILILDTPGVIPESEYSHSKTSAIQKQSKLGARTLDKIRDPELMVIGLMKEYSKQIEDFYQVTANNDSDLLIQEIGKKFNFMKKGGTIDEDRVSRVIIRDWQEGKIKTGNI